MGACPVGASKNGIALARTTGPTPILIAEGSGGICLITTGPPGGGSGCSSTLSRAVGDKTVEGQTNVPGSGRC